MKRVLFIPFFIFGIILLLGVTHTISLQAQSITFTGDAGADFSPLGSALQVNQADATNDIGYSDPNCGAPTGFDFQNVYMYYDASIDRLYIGLDMVGLVGDIDNNGNATTVSSGCTESEYAAQNAGYDEPIGISLNTDMAGFPEYWIGWPNSNLLGIWKPFAIYPYSATTTSQYPMIPNYVQATALSSPTITYPFVGNTAYPDVEFYIDNYMSIDPDLHMSWRAFSDANINGEDNLTGTFQYTGAFFPIDLSSFNVQFINGSAQLYWKIENNAMNHTFEIQHATDGANFESIGRVTGTNQTTYSFNDAYHPSGKNYYRIKIIDIDGKFQYSKIASVSSDVFYQLTVYPNPSKDHVTIRGQHAENYLYQVLNITGSEVFLPIIKMNDAVSFNTEMLASGVYCVVATHSAKKQIMKLCID